MTENTPIRPDTDNLLRQNALHDFDALVGDTSPTGLAACDLFLNVARDLGAEQGIKTWEVLKTQNLDPCRPEFNYKDFLSRLKASELSDACRRVLECISPNRVVLPELTESDINFVGSELFKNKADLWARPDSTLDESSFSFAPRVHEADETPYEVEVRVVASVEGFKPWRSQFDQVKNAYFSVDPNLGIFQARNLAAFQMMDGAMRRLLPDSSGEITAFYLNESQTNRLRGLFSDAALKALYDDETEVYDCLIEIAKQIDAAIHPKWFDLAFCINFPQIPAISELARLEVYVNRARLRRLPIEE